MERAVIDLEANSLLDHTVIDYTASPYKLKPNFKLWCMTVRNIDNILDFKRYEGIEAIRGWFDTELCKLKEIAAHNGIDYDFLVLKLLGIITYKFARKAGDLDEMNGHKLRITDTMVVSKTLNPDRYGGHSLDSWGERVGKEKIDWRARAVELGLIPTNAPKGAEFQQYHPEMGVYCDRDTEVNVMAYKAMEKEAAGWDWTFPLWLEHYVREIVTRQSHRGFKFDKELAESNVRELDAKMAEIRAVVEPLLPEKPLGKTALKDYIPPKVQFKKNGEVSAVMQKWVERHSGSLTQKNEGWYATLYGKDWKLPMSQEAPVKTHGPAEITDTTFIKGWLVSLGWKPTMYKERDLTCDSKKQKLSREKFEETVERYVEQTLASPFCKDRCAELDTVPRRLRERLLKHDIKRPLKVYTNPTITVGMEKEIDPALLEMADQFPHAKLVSEYLTYAHRRNSILGGGIDPDDVDEDDEFAGKGFMAAERIAVDGRIPTPADSCGAGTSRFKHRLVANVPRVTSLYGKNMRGLFGVDTEDGFIQLGYDFDSLEAKIEAHYVHRYAGGPEYGVSLTAEKPNDCHCFDQDTEILTPEGWKTFGELGSTSLVAQYDPVTGTSQFVQPVSVVWQPYNGQMVRVGEASGKVDMMLTPNHRVLFKRYRSSGWGVEEASKVLQKTCTARIPTTFELNGGIDVDTHYLNVLLAVQADGHFNKDSSAITLSFVKTRKIESLKESLDALRESYTVSTFFRNGREEVTIRIPAGDLSLKLREELTEAKELQWSLLALSAECRAFVVESAGRWDGTVKNNGDIVVDTRSKKTTEVLQALATSIGKRAVVSSYFKKTKFGEGVLHRVYIKMSAGEIYGAMHKGNTRLVDYSGMIGCVTVPAGFVVVRRMGAIFVSGNSVLAAKISGLLGRPFPRGTAKNVKYGCSYNAQPPRVAKTVGCDLDTAQVIFDAFWEQAAPLRELKERMQSYWETTGQKKFLLGIDGRKLPIRSKGNVINTAFQSAGVICAKLAMVLHEQYLQDEGMWVDFFVDDWRNRDFCQQLIAYHK